MGLRPAVPIATMVLTAALIGAVSVSGVAAADVTVTPSTGVQGSALKLVFAITEDRPPAHTIKVELRMPEATPVAEVYPLSVPDWAPKTAMRKLDRPISTLHGVGTTEVVSSVTWIRVKPPTGATTSELSISLGPLPNVDKVAFTVIQTYSDGTVVSWADAPAAVSPGASGTPGVSGTPSALGTHLAPVVTLRTPEPGSQPFDIDSLDEPVSDGGTDTPPSGGLGLLYSVLIAGVAAGGLWTGWTLVNRRRAASAAGLPDKHTPDESTGDASPPSPPPSDSDLAAAGVEGGPV